MFYGDNGIKNEYKPTCTNLLVIIVVRLSMIQFMNSRLGSIYNRACGGGDGGHNLRKMDTCPTSLSKKMSHIQKIFPKTNI